MILKGKTALITGATGVIGSTIAEFFAREGCNLILGGQKAEKLAELKNKLAGNPVNIETFVCDVSQRVEVLALADFISQQFGTLNIVVTAAGSYGCIGSLIQCEPEEWLSAIQVNLLGTMMTIKYCLPLLSQAGNNKIITFAGGGEGPMPNFSSYVSSKGGIWRLVETLAEELKSFAVEINSISPGAVRSGFTDNLLLAGEDNAGKEMYAKTLEQIKTGGESPEKAAALAVFLASDASNGLSGKNISAVWDNWQELPKHLAEIMNSDVYNFKRIKPQDRGYDWK